MPPKKNNVRSEPKKPPAKRAIKLKPEKPKLKTPTVIKVKIPIPENTVTNGTTQKLSKKQLTVQKKLELANEVALAQLYKDVVIEEPPPVVPTVSAPVKLGRKRAAPSKTEPKNKRQKKVPEPSSVEVQPPSVQAESLAYESEDAFQQPPKKKATKRTPVKKTESANNGQKNASADTTVKRPRGQPTKNNKPLCNGTTRNLRTRRNSKGNVEESATKIVSTPAQVTGDDDTMVDQREKTGRLGSRKNSVNSNTSSLSWTRDISTSSTTTCVTVSSTDFIRFDKKLPRLQLTNIDKLTNEIQNETKNVNEIEESSSDFESESSSSESCSGNVVENKLNLSTSSISELHEDTDKVAKDDIGIALDRMTSTLKNFDSEIVDWIGYDDGEKEERSPRALTQLYKILNHEIEIISQCRELKRILSDGDEAKENDDVHFVKPTCAVVRRKLSRDVEPYRPTARAHFDEPPVPVTRAPVPVIRAQFDETSMEPDKVNFTSDNVPYTSFDASADDEDALSLFAESITGLESRLGSTRASIDHEEYVPRPLRPVSPSPEHFSYQPTKIDLAKAKAVCEKQNADSTSIPKDTDAEKATERGSGTIVVGSPLIYERVPPIPTTPCLMSSRFKAMQAVKSSVFRGVCFFNIISACKNNQCRFPHVVPELGIVTRRLSLLSEDMFIQEYMLLRNYPDLRRKYGLVFVTECANRRLTRILVEMAIDFMKKTDSGIKEDVALQLSVLEMTLMHLNLVDLSTIEDFLKYKFGLLDLCNVMMQTIAVTQNFSRFKAVFIKLSRFIVDNNRSVDVVVVSTILERVCILPSEDSLIRAMLALIKQTDCTIYQNRMIDKFEVILSKLNSGVYEEFLLAKREAISARPAQIAQAAQNVQPAQPAQPRMMNPFTLSPQMNLEQMIGNSLTHAQREKRYTSPDTTNLDNMNKTVNVPVITRTIDFQRAQTSTVARKFTNLGVNMPYNWRTTRFAPRGRGAQIRPSRPLRGGVNPRPNQRQVTYGRPTDFQRRSPPDF